MTPNPNPHTKKDMMEYHRTKWYNKDSTLDHDNIFNLKREIIIFKNDPCMYYLDEIICTMDLENLFELR
jgi:hypothetical protein